MAEKVNINNNIRSLKLRVIGHNGENFGIIGNFPYNILSQILFKVLDYKERIPELVGMFQKEMALRLCGKQG